MNRDLFSFFCIFQLETLGIVILIEYNRGNDEGGYMGERLRENEKTILIVDDVPANLELLTSHLVGYNTAIAKTGRKAIQRAKLLLPDIILLDIQMPEMDGYETCRRLKDDPDTQDIPVIFMTALTDTQSKLEGFSLGAVDYVTKPFDSAELRARIETHLTLALVQKELKEKNEILEKNFKKQKRVEQILRHDMKSPLQAFLSIPELIKMKISCDSDLLSLFDMLGDAAHGMLNMINSSLTLYKIEQGVYAPKFEAVDVATVIGQVVAALSHKFSSSTVDVRDLSVGAKVRGEELLLYSLFSNLLKNALEASPSGYPVQVLLTCSEVLLIKITNRGSVPLEIRDSFFDEFSSVGKEHGTGLGTYSAKLITNTLNGSIELDSSVDDETTILVTLPLF